MPEASEATKETYRLALARYHRLRYQRAYYLKTRQQKAKAKPEPKPEPKLTCSISITVEQLTSMINEAVTKAARDLKSSTATNS